jgi:cytochrome c biogenesis protein CcdA
MMYNAAWETALETVQPELGAVHSGDARGWRRGNVITAILAFVGGVLTILSPCILPVLPFVFARADQPFRRSGLPLLTGMALTFSVVAVAAAFGGHWVVRLNDYGRLLALILLTVSGLTLLSETRQLITSNRCLRQPLYFDSEAGAGMSRLRSSSELRRDFCGLHVRARYWTHPDRCRHQRSERATTALLFAYALGADFLAVVTVIGGRVFVAMKRSLGVGEWVAYRRCSSGGRCRHCVRMGHRSSDESFSGKYQSHRTITDDGFIRRKRQLSLPQRDIRRSDRRRDDRRRYDGRCHVGGAMMSNTAHAGGPG